MKIYLNKYSIHINYCKFYNKLVNKKAIAKWKLRIIRKDGDPSRKDINQFGSLNYHFCFRTLRTLDVEPPRVDSCISPPPYTLKKGRRAAVTWDDPVFSDNSRGVLNIHRTQADLKRFPVGTTLVKYTATDKYGNNATCTVKVVVKGILLFAYLFITARKRSLRRLCFYTCLSFILFTGGVPDQVPPRSRHPPRPDTPSGADTPPDQVHHSPWDQVHPPGPGAPPQDQVPPGARYTLQTRYTPLGPGTPPRADTHPPDQAHPPGTRSPPLDQVPPSGPGTPPRAEHAGRYNQCAGGLHPTGMQSCLHLQSFQINFCTQPC